MQFKERSSSYGDDFMRGHMLSCDGGSKQLKSLLVQCIKSYSDYTWGDTFDYRVTDGHAGEVLGILVLCQLGLLVYVTAVLGFGLFFVSSLLARWSCNVHPVTSLSFHTCSLSPLLEWSPRVL